MGLDSLRPDSAKKESTKHCDHKFERKLQFYAKVKDTVASLSAKKSISKKKRLRSRQKKLKVYDLSSLAEFLPEFNGLKESEQRPTDTNLKHAKSRQKLVEKERNHYLEAFNDRAFQSDPISAIHDHLLKTQPVQVEKPGKSSGKTGKKKMKKKKKKSNKSGARSMDI